ncbi:MAG: Gfo/Idh/MocA family oxidoreductase [Polyangiales bacterium]
MPNVLRGAVVGYGFIAENGHVPAYLARAKRRGDVAIVAVADLCPERRALAKKHLPGARIYADHASLLAAEAKNLDFVDIAAPPYVHAEIAHAAFEQRLHVLCEKPIAFAVDDARKILLHAVEARRVFFPCHNYKHAPVIKAVRRVLESGRIGKVRSVSLHTYRNTHAKGVPEWSKDWRRSHKFAGGGIAMDHGSHTFYLAFDWLSAFPTAVTAKMSALDGFDTEDNFTCSLTFPGGIANAYLTWTAGVRKVIYTIQGEHGAITVQDDEIEVAQMRATDGPDVGKGAVGWTVERQVLKSDWMDASHVTWFDSLFEQFKTAIDKGDFVGDEAMQAFRCIEVICTAYDSARDGSRELPLNAAL